MADAARMDDLVTPLSRLRSALDNRIPYPDDDTIVRTDDLAALLAVVEAAQEYSPQQDHDWRCEYRTEKVGGWRPGDPPVIVCECGFDRLRAALAAIEDEPA